MPALTELEKVVTRFTGDSGDGLQLPRAQLISAIPCDVAAQKRFRPNTVLDGRTIWRAHEREGRKARRPLGP